MVLFKPGLLISSPAGLHHSNSRQLPEWTRQLAMALGDRQPNLSMVRLVVLLL